ncbi:MAG: SprT-like domain-containing protein [Candidatus Tectimicrobiota bacterium]
MQSLIIASTASQSDRQAWLSAQLATRVTLIWTDNRASMLSARGSTATGYVVRLHKMFGDAPTEVWHALVAYVRRAGPQATRTLRDYIRRQQHRLLTTPPTHPLVLEPCGQYFDLAALYQDLNQRYFVNRVQADITWSRRPPQRQRTSIRFGSYHERDRLIRVHRLLDQPFVPRYVVENVVFHEMLHQLIPRQYRNGRWSIHPPEFRQQERRFEYYPQAEQWQKLHLGRLLQG